VVSSFADSSALPYFRTEADSPEHHEESARSYTKSKGWLVKEVYNLAGQSGKAVMQHAEAKRMMNQKRYEERQREKGDAEPNEPTALF